VERIGCGMGTKDFPAANCLRALLGESGPECAGGDTVWELCCNLDDMTPEAVAFTQKLLLERGALDAYTVPIGIKKNRPGIQLWCLCAPEKLEEMRALLFRYTTTWGMRAYETRRFTMERTVALEQTSLGPVRVKTGTTPGVIKTKLEYEDVARVAAEMEISAAEAETLLRRELEL
jgi:uncharacterized protein (DUF111 family)